MSSIFEDTLVGLIEAIYIEMGELELKEIKSYLFMETTEILNL